MLLLLLLLLGILIPGTLAVDSGTETNKLGAMPPLLVLLAVAPPPPALVVVLPTLSLLLLPPCLLLPLPLPLLLLLPPGLLDSVLMPKPTPPTEAAPATAELLPVPLLLLIEVVAAAMLAVAVVGNVVPLLAIVAVVTLANVAFTSAVADVWWVGGLSSVRCCKEREKERERKLVLCYRKLLSHVTLSLSLLEPC